MRVAYFFLIERSRIIWPRISRASNTQVFFVGYKVQALRIESMKPIGSHTVFWKNMDKLFNTGHCKQSTGLVLRSFLVPAVK